MANLKSEYLSFIRPPATKCKRVALLNIHYFSSRSLATGCGIDHLPFVQRVFSLFFGGGSIESAGAQKLEIQSIGDDIDYSLVDYRQYQPGYLRRSVETLFRLSSCPKIYGRVKKICKQWVSGKVKCSKLELATYFYFNHIQPYNSSFVGWAASEHLSRESNSIISNS